MNTCAWKARDVWSNSVLLGEAGSGTQVTVWQRGWEERIKGSSREEKILNCDFRKREGDQTGEYTVIAWQHERCASGLWSEKRREASPRHCGSAAMESCGGTGEGRKRRKFNQGRGVFVQPQWEETKVSAKENRNNRGKGFKKGRETAEWKDGGPRNASQILFVWKTRLSHGWKKWAGKAINNAGWAGNACLGDQREDVAVPHHRVSGWTLKGNGQSVVMGTDRGTEGILEDSLRAVQQWARHRTGMVWERVVPSQAGLGILRAKGPSSLVDSRGKRAL